MTFLIQAKKPLLFLSLLVVWQLLAPVTGSAQVFELRRTFEHYESGKILIGGSLFGPVESELDSITFRRNVDFNVAADLGGYLAVDYWQIRGGLKIGMLTALAPFLYFNPIIGNDFGGYKSRWTGSLGWEGIFAQVNDVDPRKQLQPDNSIYTPANSFSLMVGYWFGEESAKTLLIDTNYAGRGFVDTMNFRTPPLDTNSYVRGRLLPSDVPTPPNAVRYSSRNGFSAALGLGTGKYAGSGPISKHLNFLAPDPNDPILSDTSKFGALLSTGLNPMAILRYRYDDWIGHFELAGEDLNLGAIYRGVPDFDFEIGVKYLEHLLDRPTRGANRSGLFLGVRYAPFGPARYEIGDEIYDPATDSDSDGLPDGWERTITMTDPTKTDTDGDGLPDGVEVYSYKTNPLVADSDGDGLSDGQEINAQRRTDPLRGDTDEDGISDGEEVTRGQDPLAPGTGIRER
jgi:hypothetical protein